MIKRIFLRWGIVLLAGVVLVVTVVFSLWDFNKFTEHHIEEEIHLYMDDIRTQSAFMLKNNMKFLISRLETEARSFSAFGKMTEEEIIAELSHFADVEKVDRATIVTPDGTVYSSDFGKQHIDPEPYAEAFTRDTTYVKSLRFFEPTGQQFIDISTPVYLAGEKFGSLSISYDNENLKEIFKVAVLEGDCSVYLLDGDGMLIGKISNTNPPPFFKENIFDLYNDEKVTFIEGSSETLREAFKNKVKGQLKYESEGKTYCASYAPSGVNDWYIATITTDESVRARAIDLEQMAGVLTAKIILIMTAAAVLFGIYYLNERRLLREMRDSYRLALKKSNDLFFEVDLANDSYINHSEDNNSRAWVVEEKTEKGENKYSDFIRRGSGLCPIDDRQAFLDRFLPEHLKRIVNSEDVFKGFEYKMVNEQGVVCWFRSMIVPVSESGGKVQKVICIEKNITEERRSTDELRNTARLDGLTQLYNKVTAKELIESFLRYDGKDGQHALLMMDIDGFKEINDAFGHIKGDEVIAGAGKILKGIFRKSDIVGRNGGDEFIAFIKDYRDIELVSTKAAQINTGFKKARFDFLDENNSGGENPLRRITVSIGIALYRRDGATFEELYENADTALFTSKNSGKDKYTFF